MILLTIGLLFYAIQLVWGQNCDLCSVTKLYGFDHASGWCQCNVAPICTCGPCYGDKHPIAGPHLGKVRTFQKSNGKCAIGTDCDACKNPPNPPTDAPPTSAPPTNAPATNAPATTDPPSTTAPVTKAPRTATPATSVPITIVPKTIVPSDTPSNDSPSAVPPPPQQANGSIDNSSKANGIVQFSCAKTIYIVLDDLDGENPNGSTLNSEKDTALPLWQIALIIVAGALVIFALVATGICCYCATSDRLTQVYHEHDREYLNPARPSNQPAALHRTQSIEL